MVRRDMRGEVVTRDIAATGTQPVVDAGKALQVKRWAKGSAKPFDRTARVECAAVVRR